jgi:hypothetical protein
MDDDTKIATLAFLICVVLVALAVFVKKTQCEGGWAASGMNAEWSFITGCSLETQPGKWIPAENYQERKP